MTTVLIAIDVTDEEAELGDVAEAVYARLEEFYPDSTGGFCKPRNRRVVATTGGVVKRLFDAAEVGLSHDATDNLDVCADHLRRMLALPDGNGVSVVDPSRPD